MLSLSSFTQTTPLFELNWQQNFIFTPDGERINTLTFPNASITPLNYWLPEFSHLEKMGSTGEFFTVELLDTEFKLLSSTEKQFLQKKQLIDRISPSVQNVIIRKENYQQVTFIPIRKNSVTGQYEKLIRFRLQFKKQPHLKASKQAKTYASNSLLQTGNWIKIGVDTTAIYKITYSELIEMGISKPEQVRIYGSGGGMLPKMNAETSIDDLLPNPIYIEKGEDGIFNSGDFLLFYAKGPRSWEFNESNKEFIHETHLYSDFSYYFLTSDMGNPIIIQQEVEGLVPNNIVSEFDDFRVIDQNKINLMETGRLWLGQVFDITTNYNFDFSFPNLRNSEPIVITTSLVARSAANTKFTLRSENTEIGTISIPSVNTGNYTSDYANLEVKQFTNFKPQSENFILNLDYEKSSPSSIAWLNFLRVNARRSLIFTKNQMAFRDSRSVGENSISRYRIQNCSESIKIWDVTNSKSVKQIPLELSGNLGEFTTVTNVLKEFIAFDPKGEFPSPKKIRAIQNQNLHGLAQPDMIIVCPPQFISYANQIADFHKSMDNLRVYIVEPEAIYNEFSSGVPDVSAIRNFIKMFYDRAANESDIPKYLLLFGDGSFDNKSTQENNTNRILTYQSENSLSPTQSFVSDDFFGLLDDNEGESIGMVDIGIGRLPVNTAEEARIVTSKLLTYHNAEFGDWRNSLCFIGDDEDNNTHMRDANLLAEQVENYYPQFKIKRIFLDDFEQITSSAGQEYPDVNKEINESINKGNLILNYTGHGNENGLAHEHILMFDDIIGWKNPQKLPLFVTATCEFSRFDNYKKLSAGEMVLLRDNGGGIGLFTTTRLVFSSPNFVLNQNFYKHVFEKDAQGNFNRLGDILRKTKNDTGSGINKRNFTLLGDPALRLNYPKHAAISLQLNDIDISQQIDTLKALSKIKISGKITSIKGDDLNNFSGTIYPTVLDKATEKSTRGNDENPFEYKEQTSVLFKGKASVVNGQFKFSFLVPKDINYSYGKGKISYYANSFDSDASGFTNTIIVGGTNPNAGDDKIGPLIELYMNDEQFSQGGITNSNPLLLAIVQDSSGINTIGNSIGHDIIAVLDHKTDQSLKLNDYYESDLDNYQKGKVAYQLSELEAGEHEIQLKVWDNSNNSSENSLNFIVTESADLVIKNILNYPNPFTTNTGFYFEHNQASHELDVLIQILTISGKLIKTIETSVNTASNRVGPIQWDGKDDFGNSIGRGVYFYRINVRSDDGKVINKFQKLVILK